MLRMLMTRSPVGRWQAGFEPDGQDLAGPPPFNVRAAGHPPNQQGEQPSQPPLHITASPPTSLSRHCRSAEVCCIPHPILPLLAFPPSPLLSPPCSPLPPSGDAASQLAWNGVAEQEAWAAVGETVILLHPPPLFTPFEIPTEGREGYSRMTVSPTARPGLSRMAHGSRPSSFRASTFLSSTLQLG